MPGQGPCMAHMGVKALTVLRLDEAGRRVLLAEMKSENKCSLFPGAPAGASLASCGQEWSQCVVPGCGVWLTITVPARLSWDSRGVRANSPPEGAQPARPGRSHLHRTGWGGEHDPSVKNQQAG